MCANDKWQPAVLQDVLYVPALHRNLLSVSQLACHGTEMHFEGKGCQILDQQKDLTCKGKLHSSLYVMGIEAMHPVTAKIAIVDEFPDEGAELLELALTVRSHMSKASLDTWHCHLGHLHEDAILTMQKNGMVTSMDITWGKMLTSPCEPCLKGKQTCAEIRKTTDNRADAVLGCIYSNVCRKLPTRSHQGYKYFLTWINNKSHKVFVMGLCEKSDVFKHLKALMP
jgi:GAG-pre-integrase domain